MLVTAAIGEALVFFVFKKKKHEIAFWTISETADDTRQKSVISLQREDLCASALLRIEAHGVALVGRDGAGAGV